MSRSVKLVVPKQEGRLPIVLCNWSEATPGRGGRPNGVSVHLNAGDHAEFVQREFGRTRARQDGTPFIVDASPSLHDYLMRKKAEGVLGVRAFGEEERVLRDGENPFSDELYSVEILGKVINKEGESLDDKVFDPTAMDVRLVDARKRVDVLETVGIVAIVADSRGDVVYGQDTEPTEEEEGAQQQRRRRRS